MSSAVHLTNEMLTPELADYQRQFERIKQDAVALVAGLNESRFNWRPAPDQWSIAECLQHLNITGDRWLCLLEHAIQQAQSRGLLGQGPFRYGWLGKWFVRNTEPPPKRKFKAPRWLTPVHGQPINAVVPTFLHLQDQLVRRLHEANGLDLARAKTATPISSLLKLSLGQSFAQIAAHERRHLWQARQVRSHPHFPSP